MHACEDFLDVVVKGHLIAAVKEMEEFRKCDDLEVEEEKYTTMFEAIEVLVKKLVNDLLSFNVDGEGEDDSGGANSDVADDESDNAEDGDDADGGEDGDTEGTGTEGGGYADGAVDANSGDGVLL